MSKPPGLVEKLRLLTWMDSMGIITEVGTGVTLLKKGDVSNAPSLPRAPLIASAANLDRFRE